MDINNTPQDLLSELDSMKPWMGALVKGLVSRLAEATGASGEEP